MTVSKQRNRAIKAITSKLGSNDYLPIDYYIDTEARKTLNLPERPQGSNPYVGWMTQPTTIKESLCISEEGKDLIKKWEGFRGKAYLCPSKVWTIGYGHTKGVKPGDTMTRREAIRLFDEEIKQYEAIVQRLVKVSLTQGQYDALTSFVYNAGEGNLARSTLLRLVNQKQFDLAANEFTKWVYGAGRKKLAGLVNRRKDEKELFLS